MSSTASDERRPLRLVRGAVVGLVGGLLGVGGHAVGGGEVPGPAAWAGVAIVLVGAVLASSRRWTAGRLVVALVGAQALVHASLWLASPGAAADPRLAAWAGASGQAGHAHAAGLDARMLAAHLAASLVAVALLAALELCALAVHGAAHAVALVRSRGLLPAAGAALLPAGVDARVVGLVVVGRRPRRGPPALPAPC